MSLLVRRYLSKSKIVTRLCFSVYAANSSKISPEFDVDYLCNADNIEEITRNIEIRKRVGDINQVIDCYASLQKAKESGSTDLSILESNFTKQAALIPNKTNPAVVSYGDTPKLVKKVNEKPDPDMKYLDFAEITRRLNIMRDANLGNVSGSRSYYFMSDLAELEEALVKYSLSRLLSSGYDLVSVPDILPSHIIESCGLNINTERSLIYYLDPRQHGPDLCLSGTAEMSLAGLLMNKVYEEDELPVKLAAVSRCYRAETSSLLHERGIYRVHEFTKVEMFAVSKPSESEAMLDEIRTTEEKLFSDLNLHFQVLDMPAGELGAPAYRKYDIEAWMPGRNIYGEISSCSNCTDYQARRLHIKYKPKDGSALRHVHTLNGTACAVPRMLIALLETHQTKDGKINIPEPLQKYFSDREFIKRKKVVPDLKIIKGKIKV